MTRVLYALIPVTVVAIYFFGWRVAAIAAVSGIACFLTEWIMVDKRGGKVSYACFVTAALYGLSLPPTTPFWIVAVGAGIAILFAKEAFGGFGKNVFNPAIVGRAFVFVCFPIELTARFVPVFTGFPGGFSRWSFATQSQVPGYIQEAGLQLTDAVSAATPMWASRDFSYSTDLLQLALGNIHGTFSYKGFSQVLTAGAAAETCAVVLILSGLYLIITKTAQWRLMLSTILGAAAASFFLRNILGINQVPDVTVTLLSGALLYAAVFMVTDPVSAPKLSLSQYLYGAFIGIMIVVIRYKAVFSGGVGFAILLGNILSPSLDLWIKRIKQKLPQKAEGSGK
ncbi:MAG: RnfABCDGE type electron transport complex subunit D [Chitinivibrionales bacterium]|nr:RnfABCDGE type electron transport complex subunit D [Chitinivibrionales bacterium]